MPRHSYRNKVGGGKLDAGRRIAVGHHAKREAKYQIGMPVARLPPGPPVAAQRLFDRRTMV